ncbi:MAG: uracil-DNA glycosylase [Desulfatitalea sp.]
MQPPGTLDETLLALRSSLAQMARWGCRGFDCSRQAVITLENWDRPPATGLSAESLDDIRADLGDCLRCGLSGGRTHLVFGEGNPRAELLFVGEGPGFDEDQSGRPFVGPAGQLLTRMIEAMHLSRDQVYICNVVKCRPPENRNPQPEEIQTCQPFLQRQIAAIRPKVICALGACATQTLLDTSASISSLRGRFHDHAGLKAMPTFHPSYLLRHPEQKRVVWEDMKKIMAFLRIPL